ncbi:hypothetical protein OCUBac02_51560 (plasmid) [Bosea sp. ANAM02]|nr:hypothetical protein OCUBac02_51560 [Bosea sp. ANAM02]
MKPGCAPAEGADASSVLQSRAEVCRMCPACKRRPHSPNDVAGFAEGFRAGIAACDGARRAEEAEAERKREAWREFEDEFLLGPGGGRVSAHVFDACEQAFERAWPDRAAASEAAKKAFIVARTAA